MSLTTLKTTMQNYFTAIKDRLDNHHHDSAYAPITHNHDDQYYTKTEVDQNTVVGVVSEEITLTASGSTTYDLTTLTTTPTDYDFLASRVAVTVKDTTVGSPTENLYVDADGTVTAGRDAAGGVTLLNTTTDELTCHVRIDLHRTVV